MESRIHGDVYVRFGGECLETCCSNVVRRWALTLLDFCFYHEGKFYNYPTIIFYQLTYELAVMWQASRRHYRLNQVTDCRTYYLAYEGTLQAAAVEIMAEKQVAASAIQGKFSAEGLTAMAKGVDPRLKLAQMLSENDTSDRKTLTNMFDALNAANKGESDGYADSDDVALTYLEVMGYTEEALFTEENTDNVLDIFHMIEDVPVVENPSLETVETMEDEEETTETETKEEEMVEPGVMSQGSLFDMFDQNFFGNGMEIRTISLHSTEVATTSKKPSRKKKDLENQLDLFQLLGA